MMVHMDNQCENLCIIGFDNDKKSLVFDGHILSSNKNITIFNYCPACGQELTLIEEVRLIRNPAGI